MLDNDLIVVEGMRFIELNPRLPGLLTVILDKYEGEIDLRDQISQSHGKRRDRSSFKQIPVEGVDNSGVGRKPALLAGQE